eukprot:CAMPEP_0170639020 /NCGR_PEP_ID=MMETSP0224-20130122/39398_1 /TAXON_ID=285029 /ORGANISM="Togula jolla, Strain CCCM 725" /LENGTH=52 /DNA_ID=CAMNT_0010969291 /DNA_START=254 /DNA_END=412 /DNA_ORIENTATION=+
MVEGAVPEVCGMVEEVNPDVLSPEVAGAADEVPEEGGAADEVIPEVRGVPME